MSKTIPIDVLEAGGDSLYVSERKVYPRDVAGRFDRLRKLAVVWLLGMYYGFPWLQWDGRQAVLFDLPARKFHVFGLTFWPQDFTFLAMLLIILALLLFFVTALAGRLWCGYACPQTVWTEVFLWIERRAEGDRHKRMKLDAGRWTGEKALRKGFKHVLWLVFALWTGFTFVGFFTPITSLAVRVWPFDWNGTETFWVLFYALATWGNAGVLREQVCKYMCPYARFQSAMFDRNTLIIAYDPLRGEPRGPRRRGLADVVARGRGVLDKVLAYELVFRAGGHSSAGDAMAQARAQAGLENDAAFLARIEEPLPRPAADAAGDCIDCTMCVQVCPTGIDIRNGLQYDCIACGACIDACDDVMDKMGYPRGLIRYSTQNAIDGEPTRVLRPRVFVYAALLLALVAGWSWGIAARSPLIAEVLRDRNALYRVTDDGIDNGYTLKLVNKTAAAQRYRISLESGTPGIVLRGGPRTVQALAEQVVSVPVEATAPATLKGRHAVRFVIVSGDGRTRETVDSSFFGPQ
ncbi:4Fe-4S dicluster domain-containing protein [Lysobacter koreensis]|uniref:4Fe-4S dicluster domain-containing protein n=1 Tax=Lysobacter koreensis TaxID=266122 RepID=A0ABW2YIA9_9GAMM